jgi:hypothetical protein
VFDAFTMLGDRLLVDLLIGLTVALESFLDVLFAVIFFE